MNQPAITDELYRVGHVISADNLPYDMDQSYIGKKCVAVNEYSVVYDDAQGSSSMVVNRNSTIFPYYNQSNTNVSTDTFDLVKQLQLCDYFKAQQLSDKLTTVAVKYVNDCCIDVSVRLLITADKCNNTVLRQACITKLSNNIPLLLQHCKIVSNEIISPSLYDILKHHKKLSPPTTTTTIQQQLKHNNNNHMSVKFVSYKLIETMIYGMIMFYPISLFVRSIEY